MSLLWPPVCFDSRNNNNNNNNNNDVYLAPTGALEEGILCVRPSVRPCVILFKITVKMSSSSILKSPGGF